VDFATRDEAERLALSQYGQGAFGETAITWTTPKGKEVPPSLHWGGPGVRSPSQIDRAGDETVRSDGRRSRTSGSRCRRFR
jgi:hypothetical protein